MEEELKNNYMINDIKLNSGIYSNIVPLDFGMSSLELSYLVNEVGKSYNKEKLSYNMLIASILDDKMYYKENNNIPSYQHNNIVLINNEKNIIPLSFNIKNLNSSLTIENDEILFKIDNNTIKEKDNKLVADYNNINLADHNPGLFKPDGDSMIIENNKITLSNNIKDIINDIDNHIDIMNTVIDQSSNNLDTIMGIYKEYTLYDKKYSCNTNLKYPIYYSDENNNDIESILINNEENETISLSNEYSITTNKYYNHIIDYYQEYFKLKIKFVYNYQSSSLPNFNPFDEDNISITIIPINNNITLKQINNIIKFNKNKSYVYNNEIDYYNESNNNAYGEINYICYFNIDNKELYNCVNNYYNNTDILDNNFKNLDFKVIIRYNDTKIKSDSFTLIQLRLLVDDYKDKHVHKVLYHNYNVGFNYEGIGNMVGICMYEKNTSKPIFIKYFNNENNYIINNISEDVLTEELYYTNNNEKTIKNQKIVISLDSLSELCNNDEMTINLIDFSNNDSIYYRNVDLMKILSNSPKISGITFDNTNNLYKSSLRYCFNSTYNIYGNGLRKGDCYIPSINELIIFYILGFYFYVSYIGNNIVLYSSTFCEIGNKKRLEVIGINYNNENKDKISIIHNPINTLRLLDDKTINPENNDANMIYRHTSISLFKLPDFAILNGYNYYVSYDIENNCEIIDYITKKDIKIRIKCYNKSLDNKYEIIKRISFYCNSTNVNVKLQDVIDVSESTYEVIFNLENITNEYNDVDLYYVDSDESFNKEFKISSNNNIYCRHICRISIKNIF